MDASPPFGMLCLTLRLFICNVDCVNFNVYFVLLFRVNSLFDFNYFVVDAMGGVLKGINQDNRNYDTSMNSFKGPSLLDEALKPAAVSSVTSDNSISERNNDIVTETDGFDDGSVKPYSPSGI